MDCRMRVIDLGFRMRCSINADVGKEGESALLPARKPRKVMIIGAGPAGMEAARIARLRGHRVSLYDQQKKLGGQVNLAVMPPHKEELKNILDYLGHQMKALKIPVKLGVRVDSGMIQKTKPDVLVIATGAKPILPSFEGNVPPKLLTPQEVLERKLPKEENFLVIGGASLGCELAEYLAEKGKRVSVVEILGQIAADAESNARKLLTQRLAERKVLLYTRSRVQRFEGNRAFGVNESGEKFEVPADVVVAAMGSQSCTLAIKGLEKMRPTPEVYTIGDCRQAGKIMQAIHDGNRIGRII